MGKMLFSNSSRADLSIEVNWPDHKVFIQYSLGNFSRFTHANAKYPNVKSMNLWTLLSGKSSCSAFISLCNKLLHPWLAIIRWWMLCSFSQAVGWNNTARHFFFFFFFFREIVFSQNYAKAELLILYTRELNRQYFCFCWSSKKDKQNGSPGLESVQKQQGM